MGHSYISGLTDLSMWGGLLYVGKFGFCESCAHRKQYESAIFGDSALLRPSKLVEDKDLNVQLGVELECSTHILLRLVDVVSNLI